MKFLLLILIIGCSSTFAQQFSHNKLIMAVDASFQNRDKNGDSILELIELLDFYTDMDTDHDGKVSEFEYEQIGTYHDFFGIVFLQLDHNGDGYLDRAEDLGQYILMDTIPDDMVSRREYDDYYIKVVEDAFKNYGYLLPSFPTNSTSGSGGAATSK